MADVYTVGNLPEEYNAALLIEELRRISISLQELEPPQLLLIPQAVAPEKLMEGMVVFANGTDWDPGHGGGLYEYKGGSFNPLFSLGQDYVISQLVVQNTTTETEIYSTTVKAGALSIDSLFKASIAGSYDTAAGSDTWTLRFKQDGVTLHSISRQDVGNVADAGWLCEYQGTIRTEGASGTAVGLIVLHDYMESIAVSDASTHSVDTTVAVVFSVTIQWGAAKTGNIFRRDHGLATFVH